MSVCKNFAKTIESAALILDWNTAKNALKKYQKHPRNLLLELGISSKVTHGFYAKKSEMQKVINNTPRDNIILMPAVHPDDLNKTGDKQNITIVFASLKQDGTIDTNSVFDYCLPCPKACPSNYPL